jgi:solute carrier family 41
MVIPGHIIFVYLESLIEHHLPSVLFLVLFLVAALLQVAMLLYLANWLVRFFWSWKCDPDNYAIPYLTALADLIGTGFIAVVFYILTVSPYEFSDFEDVADSALNATTIEPLLTTVGL